MKIKITILIIVLSVGLFGIRPLYADNQSNIEFDFYGASLQFQFDKSSLSDFKDELSASSVKTFVESLSSSQFDPVFNMLLHYKENQHPDDWLYYQLIRKTVQQISPKKENYYRYTMLKWFLLTRSGYDAILTLAPERILFYVRSDENIYNTPSRIHHGKQYVCLNYHDYQDINVERENFTIVPLDLNNTPKIFSYKITQLPDFKPEHYEDKNIRFTFYEQNYDFKVKLNKEIKTIFANYPVVDYESYFNIPLSRETYGSLIPLLKKNIKGLNVKSGVDYLMRFTRYAFMFESDMENFGGEKRLSPEQTLLSEYSDCEDRAALFFYLVKEIYNMPMIVLVYPKHVTIAVKFDKPIGNTIKYNGDNYSVCEPTPQKTDLSVGQILPELKRAQFEIAYAYTPKN